MTIKTTIAGTAATQSPKAYKINRKIMINGRSANVTRVAETITSFKVKFFYNYSNTSNSFPISFITTKMIKVF